MSIDYFDRDWVDEDDWLLRGMTDSRSFLESRIEFLKEKGRRRDIEMRLMVYGQTDAQEVDRG